jgi:hypothetical protein
VPVALLLLTLLLVLQEVKPALVEPLLAAARLLSVPSVGEAVALV